MERPPRSPYLPLFEREQPQRPEPQRPEPRRDARPAKPWREEDPPIAPRPRDSEPVLSVADLTGRLRRQMQMIGQVVVVGEVSGFKGAGSSGHLYFSLKDEREEAVIACAMFRRDAQVAGGERIVNGARVRVRCSPDLFAPRGALQMLVSRVMAAGEGDLAARREALKKKLAAEGLFEPARKRPLPSDPRVIGVVTSASGAAFHDIVKVAHARAGVRILLAPAAVQGDGASVSLRRALDTLAQVAEVDVIILGRGGGSAEDLAAFDDERLARAIASCPKPVVAAVGHEVDWSIACLVADVRAATPSQAAELVVPDARARRDRLRETVRRLVLAMRGRTRHGAAILARLETRVRAPERAIAVQRQRIDELQDRLESAMRAQLRDDARARDALERRLAARHPRTVIGEARQTLAPAMVRLEAAMVRALDRRKNALANAAQKLDAISPLAVLSRGYSIALHGGHALRDAANVKPGDKLELRLERGRVEATVDAAHDTKERS